jgi:hypothetical protein
MQIHRYPGLRWLAGALVGLALLATSIPAEAQIRRRYQVSRGAHELSGGIGFAADLSRYAPGGFKWFNEYGQHLSGKTWLNLQLNVVLGDGDRCYWYRGDVWRCEDDGRFDGNALELVGGVKVKWPNGPVQVHAKFGGAVNLIWFDAFYGAALGFRGGAGVRYFVIPTLSVGGELVATVGPAFMRYDLGTELYGTLDFNIGVEWRF